MIKHYVLNYTRSLVYKGWLIRDGFLGLVIILENLRDED